METAICKKRLRCATKAPSGRIAGFASYCKSLMAIDPCCSSATVRGFTV